VSTKVVKKPEKQTKQDGSSIQEESHPRKSEEQKKRVNPYCVARVVRPSAFRVLPMTQPEGPSQLIEGVRKPENQASEVGLSTQEPWHAKMPEKCKKRVSPCTQRMGLVQSYRMYPHPKEAAGCKKPIDPYTPRMVYGPQDPGHPYFQAEGHAQKKQDGRKPEKRGRQEELESNEKRKIPKIEKIQNNGGKQP